jgi:hypothetical protein
MVCRIINRNANELGILYTIQKHNVRHVSLLDHYTTPIASQAPSELQSTIVNDSGEWDSSL